MTSPMTEAREAIVAALEPLGVTIYGAPPETVTPPAALVMPNEQTWSKPITYGKTEVAFTVTFLAAIAGTNAAALERLEALTGTGVTRSNRSDLRVRLVAPRLLKIGPAEVAAADLAITIHVTDTEEFDQCQQRRSPAKFVRSLTTTISGTAQVTTASVDETAASETIQTLGGSVAVSQGTESNVSAEFLYDGEQVRRRVLCGDQGGTRRGIGWNPRD